MDAILARGAELLNEQRAGTQPQQHTQLAAQKKRDFQLSGLWVSAKSMSASRNRLNRGMLHAEAGRWFRP